MKKDYHMPNMFNEAKIEPPRSLWPQSLAAVAATIGGVIWGSCIGWSGPAIPLLINSTEAEFLVTQNQCNLIASLQPGGSLFGGKMLRR